VQGKRSDFPDFCGIFGVSSAADSDIYVIFRVFVKRQLFFTTSDN
jgi:hypothetical protein